MYTSSPVTFFSSSFLHHSLLITHRPPPPFRPSRSRRSPPFSLYTFSHFLFSLNPARHSSAIFSPQVPRRLRARFNPPFTRGSTPGRHVSTYPSYNSFFPSAVSPRVESSAATSRWLGIPARNQNGNVCLETAHLLPFTRAENFAVPPVIVLTADANWIEGKKGRRRGAKRRIAERAERERERRENRREGHRSPYRHALRFQVMPSLVHLVQSSLQHNSVILAGQRAQQLPACAVQGRVYVSVCFDFRLQVL